LRRNPRRGNQTTTAGSPPFFKGQLEKTGLLSGVTDNTDHQKERPMLITYLLVGDIITIAGLIYLFAFR